MLEASRITDGLYVGSAPPPGNYSRRFDVIYLVADEYQPKSRYFPGVKLRRFPFDDSLRPSDRDLMTAWTAAEHVARDMRLGRRVLVTCAMGRNRSAFVAAIALHLLTGEPGSKMGKLVIQKRTDPLGVPALSNRSFRTFLAALD